MPVTVDLQPLHHTPKAFERPRSLGFLDEQTLLIFGSAGYLVITGIAGLFLTLFKMTLTKHTGRSLPDVEQWSELCTDLPRAQTALLGKRSCFHNFTFYSTTIICVS